MSTLSELFNLLTKGVFLLAQNRSSFAMTVLTAFVLAGLSWYLCNNYVKLWNRRFRLTATHQTLTVLASILTFFFVLAFGGLTYMKDVAGIIVSFWEEYEIKADDQWSSATFKDAYYRVKGLNTENFADYPSPENGGRQIPTTKKVAQETAASVYATAACDHFNQRHPFLSKIIWSDPNQSAKSLSGDVVDHFKKNPGKSYSAEKAISIASESIKTQLGLQTPRTVTVSRIALLVMYLLVMAIPLGLIGYAAYKDIRIQR